MNKDDRLPRGKMGLQEDVDQSLLEVSDRRLAIVKIDPEGVQLGGPQADRQHQCGENRECQRFPG